MQEMPSAPSAPVEIIEREMDVRPGGRERLVCCYEMHLDDRKISVSVATLQLKVDGKRTQLTLTEQDAFLAGYDHARPRERGTIELLDALSLALAM